MRYNKDIIVTGAGSFAIPFQRFGSPLNFCGPDGFGILIKPDQKLGGQRGSRGADYFSDFPAAHFGIKRRHFSRHVAGSGLAHRLSYLCDRQSSAHSFYFTVYPKNLLLYTKHPICKAGGQAVS